METTLKTLEEWAEQSPNRTPHNRLIPCESPEGTFFRWNLKPHDPDEKDFFVPNPETLTPSPLTP